MTEEGARAWVAERFGSEAVSRLSLFADLVIRENQLQNLIAPSTIDTIWSRHLLDSAQLVPLSRNDGMWIDVGTGGGFPGFVVALLRSGPTTLIEPRRRRADFLSASVDALGLSERVTVLATKVENVTVSANIVSARAVASVENLLRATVRCSTEGTRWLLPRGRIDPAELNDVRHRWNGVFHMEQSVSDPSSSILVIDRMSER